MTIKYGVNDSRETKLICDELNKLEKRVKILEELMISHIGVKVD